MSWFAHCPLHAMNPRRPAYSGRKSCGISRNVPGPSAGAVGSAQTPIWPYSSLRLLPAPTVAPKALSLRLVAGIEAGAPGPKRIPSRPLLTQLRRLCLGLGRLHLQAALWGLFPTQSREGQSGSHLPIQTGERRG